VKVAPLALAALTLALLSRAAHADPNLWQRAREPAAAEQQKVLNRMERILGSIGLPELDPEMSAAAIAMSVLSQTLPACPAKGDPALHRSAAQARFDYLIGGALYASRTNREAEARCVLERALESAPDSPLAAEGWFHLALATGQLGDRLAERRAYLHALSLTWEPDIRAVLRVNLAESEMGGGDLKAALRDYRLALPEAQQPDTMSAAYFGLAVALDRSGDLPSSLEAARNAISIPLPPTLFPVASVLDLPGTFFSPSYEIHYYRALAAMASARQAKDDPSRRDALADAEEQWTAYLVPAEADHAPWAARARLHHARIERELFALTAKLPKYTRPAPDAGDDVL
jgi:tetratricopeptide (TPR) repeat protein